MFARYFFALCALILFAAVANAGIEESGELKRVEEKFDDVEERNPLLAVALRILRQAFKWAAKHCLEEAAHHCKQHWRNPKALIKCAGGFLQANKGRCVVG